jgi:general stress protein 26
MDMNEYFEKTSGVGVLSTASKDGEVNSALFARPHVENNTALFVTIERKNLQNLKENPNAYYLFKEDGEGYEGLRMVLKLKREFMDDKLADKLSRGHKASEHQRHILEFEIVDTHPLVGA